MDCNLEMLALARRHRQTVAERLGYSNVDFRYGLIQDLSLDLDLLGHELKLRSYQRSCRLAGTASQSRGSTCGSAIIYRWLRMDSVDCVVSNCVSEPHCGSRIGGNLFAPRSSASLKRAAGRAISDIVSDEDVPESLAA